MIQNTVTINIRTVNGVYEPEHDKKDLVYYNSLFMSKLYYTVIIDMKVYNDAIDGKFRLSSK